MGAFASFLRDRGQQDVPATMTPPVKMAPGMIQHPMHAMIAPIGPPPPDLPPMGMAGPPPDISGMSAKPQVNRKMSPLEEEESHEEQKLMGDYQKDSDPWGSADNHPGFLGKLGHGLSVVAQNSQHEEGKMTPREAEEQKLQTGLQTVDAEKSKEGLEGATTAHTQEETGEMPGKTQSEEGLQGAQTTEANARADSLNNPPPEIHDTEQGPMLIDRRTGVAQPVTANGQPIGPKLNLKESQPVDGPDGKPHTYMLDDKGNKVVDLGVHYERPINVNAGQSEKNLWSVPQPDGSHKVISLKPGDTIPTGAVSLSGQSTENSKAGAADAPTVDALKFANDYLQSGAFTGPSDEALQDQFFQMAKPSTGFRMNQAQISQLHDMASWMDSWKGRAYHAINGTWFAPQQRQQIVQTMNDLAKSKGIGGAGAQGGGQMIRARDPQGGLHEAPAGTPLPAGWKAQ
jgi:hypothetical protein